MLNLNKYLIYLNKWIVTYCKQAKTNGVVVGISGGIDSAVVATIANMRKDLKVIGV
jgi:NAD+ synthase